MNKSTAYLHVHLTYKDGCGELWVLKQLRTRYPSFGIVSDTPSRWLVNLSVPAGREAELQALYRESWVADVVLIDRSGRRLPKERQLPSRPSDLDSPFPDFRK